jgi:hypothetical protein
MNVASFGRVIALTSLVLLGAGTARADPPGGGALPVLVVSMLADGADDQADALTATLRNRVRTLKGYSLGEGDYSLEVLTLGLKCGDNPDEICQAKIGEQIHADRYIWGKVRKPRGGKLVTAEIHLWTRGRPSTRTQFTYSENLTTPGDEALKRLVDDALAKLLERGHKGTVDVRAQGITAGDLFVDGQSSGLLRNGQARLTLAPGEHKVELRSASLVERGAVTVRADANVELVLAPVEGEPASAASSRGAAGGNVAASVAAGDQGGGHASHAVTGWAAVGLGVGLLAGGVYSVVRVHQIDTDPKFDLYRRGFHHGQDVCEQARNGVASPTAGAATPDEMHSMCSQATTFQTLQYIFFGLGAVSAGAGVYLLASDRGSPSDGMASSTRPRRASWSVAPYIGKSSGHVELSYEF